MVLESLIEPLTAEEHPLRLVFLGFIYASLGLILGVWIFRDHVSLIMVFLTSMAAIPLIYNINKVEEKKDLSEMSEKNLFREHAKALNVFMSYFGGVTVAFALWFLIGPLVFKDLTVNELFRVQIDTIFQIRSNVTGNAFQSMKAFTDILSNNLKVMIFCILFSFLYGIGAVFILTWNASVIGVAIGETIRESLSRVGTDLHITLAPHYTESIMYGLFRYTIHGIPEILAYFVAGLAGGIISTAAIRHDFGTKQYEKIVMDSSVLLLFSLGLVVVAAVLEVWVTPVFF